MIETGEEVATDISLVYRVRAVVFDREVRNNGNQIVLPLNIYPTFYKCRKSDEVLQRFYKNNKFVHINSISTHIT